MKPALVIGQRWLYRRYSSETEWNVVEILEVGSSGLSARCKVVSLGPGCSWTSVGHSYASEPISTDSNYTYLEGQDRPSDS